jgi:hypothetical protein
VSSREDNVQNLPAQVGSLQTQLNNFASVTSATASSSAAIAKTADTTLSIVQSSAERLYDTCALTSDLWFRSFPLGNAPAWTGDQAEEQTNQIDENVDLERCYQSGAQASAFGVLPPAAAPDDLYDSTFGG